MGGNRPRGTASCSKRRCAKRLYARGVCWRHYAEGVKSGEFVVQHHRPRAPCIVCGKIGSGRGVNGTLCKVHYLCERKRAERGAPPLQPGELPRGRAIDEQQCFVCGRNAKRRGRHVYLCNSHGKYEYERLAKGLQPFGTESDTPPGFDGPPSDEATDEAKIDQLLAARRVHLDDREKPRIDPWFQRGTWWG